MTLHPNPGDMPTAKWSHASRAKTYEFDRHPEYPAVRRIVQTNPYTYRVRATNE